MTYTRMYYHLIWSTWNRTPWLTGERANMVEAMLRNETYEMKGLIHTVFVRPDRAHMALTIPATLAVADAVSRLKASQPF